LAGQNIEGKDMKKRKGRERGEGKEVLDEFAK
jgi:hypothetical protein